MSRKKTKTVRLYNVEWLGNVRLSARAIRVLQQENIGNISRFVTYPIEHIDASEALLDELERARRQIRRKLPPKLLITMLDGEHLRTLDNFGDLIEDLQSLQGRHAALVAVVSTRFVPKLVELADGPSAMILHELHMAVAHGVPPEAPAAANAAVLPFTIRPSVPPPDKPH